jgi:hypothetical protein
LTRNLIFPADVRANPEEDCAFLRRETAIERRIDTAADLFIELIRAG